MDLRTADCAALGIASVVSLPKRFPIRVSDPSRHVFAGSFSNGRARDLE
jgi:hypothetical protein